MAMVDDCEWLLSHVRHAFITSDDTGMCELCMQDSDLISLPHLQAKFQKTPERSHMFEQTDQTHSTSKHRVPSPDIMPGWDFGGRRRSNTAQKLERIRLERQNRIKVKTIKWEKAEEKLNSEDLEDLFKKKVIVKKNIVNRSDEVTSSNWNDLIVFPKSSSAENESKQVEKKQQSLTGVIQKAQSSLSKQLQLSNPDFINPFRDYSRFNGRGQANLITQSISMFVYPFGCSVPVGPINVVILKQGTKVVDLIGLTCWQYKHEGHMPALQQVNVSHYSVKISEDDGEVDPEFPVLLAYEPVYKFSFPTLALFENSTSGGNGNLIDNSLVVKINHCYGSLSVQLDDSSVLMGEVMKKALIKLKGSSSFVGTYQLEYQNKVGVAVKEDQTLDSIGEMEFYLLRKYSSRKVSKSAEEIDDSADADSVQCDSDILHTYTTVFK